MLECIKERPGTIGYIDAGQGLAAGLSEISIKNKFGRLLTSQDAIANGGVGAREGVLPSDPSADFGSVSLMNQDGEYTWPISLLTYLMVRLDLSFIEDPREKSLLVAFLKSLYNPGFVQRCVDRYGFTLASGASYDIGQKAIAMLESNLASDTPIWTFEDRPESRIGAGDYVISSNRRSFTKRERDTNAESIEELMEAMEVLQARVTQLSAELNDGSKSTTEDGQEFSSADQTLIYVGLISGLIGLCLASVAIVLFCKTRDVDDKEQETKRESAV